MSVVPQAAELSAVAAVAARLGEAGVYEEVLGVLDAAGGVSPRTPAAFVLPLAEDAAESVAPAVRAVQYTTATIGVQSVISAPNDRTGARARDELSALLAASRAALAGWKPPGGREVLRFYRGRLLGIDGGRVFWLDEYRLRWWTASAAGKPARLRA